MLAAVNVIGNAIGEPGARSLMEVFDANPRLQSLLGVKPGSTSADLSKTNMQPHDCIILAHELNASRAAAVLASVNLSGNRAIDQESRSALQESVSSRQPTIELIWDK